MTHKRKLCTGTDSSIVQEGRTPVEGQEPLNTKALLPGLAGSGAASSTGTGIWLHRGCCLTAFEVF